MASADIYKTLFSLQTVMFLIFIFNYYRTTDVIHVPKPSRTDACECQRSGAVGDVDLGDTRGPLSNCSLSDIRKRPGVILLTTTNTGFLDMTINLLMSIRRTGVCVNTTIIAEDDSTYRYLQKKAERDPVVFVVKTASGDLDDKEILRKNPKEYYNMMNKRQAYILPYLEKGIDVLFTDSDTFWFRDPFPFFTGQFDISLIDSRNAFGVRNTRSNFCAGFVYFKPTNATISFIKGWIGDMARHGWRRSDQTVMNGLLHGDKPVHVDIKPLDTNLFPWGPKFYSLLAKKANYSTVMMHAASIRGHEAKVAKFMSSDMWLVNATSKELVGNSSSLVTPSSH